MCTWLGSYLLIWLITCVSPYGRILCILISFFLDGECPSNFVCPFPWHMSRVCNPLQPIAVCVLGWAAIVWYCLFMHFSLLCVFTYFHIPSVSTVRNFYKFLYLIYILLSVACNPLQPFIVRVCFSPAMRYLCYFPLPLCFWLFRYSDCVHVLAYRNFYNFLYSFVMFVWSPCNPLQPFMGCIDLLSSYFRLV